MTVSNPAAPTYFPRPVLYPHGNPILPFAGVSWVQQIRTASKVARYQPILGDLAADPDHLAIFLVGATGRLADPVMKLVKVIVQDSPSRSILNHYCTQIGGAIARYNAMATQYVGAVLSPLFPHLGGKGGGVILLHACSYVYNT
jgi:hypothetical protein